MYAAIAAASAPYKIVANCPTAPPVRSSGNFNTAAAKMIGVASKKENRAACS